MKKHVMLDLETMGTGSDAAIVSIGAVVFDLVTGELGAEFYKVIDLSSSARYGSIEGSTVKWWMQQSEQARVIFADDVESLSLRGGLQQFNDWLANRGDRRDICVWGNGSGFDNVILINAYKSCSIRPNFSHWNDRDCRTIVDMGRDILGIDPKSEMVREGVHHSALDDAKFQAKYVALIWSAFAALKQ